eukprot:jgi/Pico_ML_1/50962/g2076.t1
MDAKDEEGSTGEVVEGDLVTLKKRAIHKRCREQRDPCAWENGTGSLDAASKFFDEPQRNLFLSEM